MSDEPGADFDGAEGHKPPPASDSALIFACAAEEVATPVSFGAAGISFFANALKSLSAVICVADGLHAKERIESVSSREGDCKKRERQCDRAYVLTVPSILRNSLGLDAMRWILVRHDLNARVRLYAWRTAARCDMTSTLTALAPPSRWSAKMCEGNGTCFL